MMNKFILKALLILNLIILSIIIYLLTTTALEQKSILKLKPSPEYDWYIEVILCKKCSPYEVDTISQKELELAKNEIISNFKEEEVAFDKYRNNGFFIKATNDAKNEISNIKLTKLTIETVRWELLELLIDEGLQKIPESSETIYKCVEDKECVPVKSECCGCMAGGTAIAINRDYYNYWEKKLDSECKGIACIQMISHHWTCSSQPKCINNKCQLLERKQS